MVNKKLSKPVSEINILVTGGAGYIGSHTCVELLAQGYKVIIVDDLSNANKESLKRIRDITACGNNDLIFYEGSILDKKILSTIFTENNIDAIIHFAGFKAVGESVEKPLEYYQNNISGTLTLCQTARAFGVKNLIFSSSATVYGDSKIMPISEKTPKGLPTNPYGQTKNMIEQILTDLYLSDNEWNLVFLRYFNPIGAHESGLIGEDPTGVPNNLVPYVAQVAVGRLEKIRVFGDDYPTPDGTGVRDYIHVVDLARGHVKALEWMGGKCGSGKANDHDSIEGSPTQEGDRRGVAVFNLGTGKGSSVYDVIHSFEKACGKKLSYEISPRRNGDIAICYAECKKAAKELNWTATYDINQACIDSWKWQSLNPEGY